MSTTGYQAFPISGTPSWKPPVSTASALPLTGNLGDARAAEDSGVIYVWTGSSWTAPSGSGTVTSVAMTVPSFLSVSGSPITGAGTLAVTLATQAKNLLFAGPSSGSDAAPTFRALIGADLPLPAIAALGGVFSKAAVSHQFLTSISSVDGSVGQAQPAFTDISGSLAGSQLPAFTGDVTNSSAAMTVAKIAGVAVGTPTGTGNVVFSASPTLTGTAVLASATISGTLKAGNYHLEPSENNAGNSSTALTIDWSAASAQKVTLNGNCTFTFSNGVTGGAYVLKLVQDATGSRTATWPAAVKWSGGTAPTLTTTAGQVDLINFYYDGTDWFGTFSLNYTP